MNEIISICNLHKQYPSGFKPLTDISLTIHRGEIFALLGANGAGKTTLINTICGISRQTSGTITIDGHDNQTKYREARSLIGLVPQELSLNANETIWSTVIFSRKLFGKKNNNSYIEKLLKTLSLFDKKNSKTITLSGGMKRRVLIAKALAHEPSILFLDEPTAGVDIELRRDMWQMVRKLKQQGMTIMLTTHYIEEAEEMADRIGIIKKGEIVLVDDKSQLMHAFGKKQLTLQLNKQLDNIPNLLSKYNITLSTSGSELTYNYDTDNEHTSVIDFLKDLNNAGIFFKDLKTTQRSLEEIFVSLIGKTK
jgi:ABC-2 type transport system ATP-binding protein